MNKHKNTRKWLINMLYICSIGGFLKTWLPFFILLSIILVLVLVFSVWTVTAKLARINWLTFNGFFCCTGILIYWCTMFSYTKVYSSVPHNAIFYLMLYNGTKYKNLNVIIPKLLKIIVNPTQVSSLFFVKKLFLFMYTHI